MEKIGFLGLGTMGLPMAVNIAKSHLDLMVYNRTRGKAGPAVEAGAKEADNPAAIFDWADTVVMMLSGPQAIDEILGPILQDRPRALQAKVLVNMGTNSPIFSQRLNRRLESVGAQFVDAPVSGTRVFAEQGALVIMASGREDIVDRLAPIFEAVGSKVIKCGVAPQATLMKLAVNIVLSASIAGLAEGANFAQKSRLDLNTFFQVIQGGPMGNDVFALKAKQMMERDFTPQASIRTAREMLKHIIDAAYEMNVHVPTTLSNANLMVSAMNQGLADEDACAVIKVFEK